MARSSAGDQAVNAYSSSVAIMWRACGDRSLPALWSRRSDSSSWSRRQVPSSSAKKWYTCPFMWDSSWASPETKAVGYVRGTMPQSRPGLCLAPTPVALLRHRHQPADLRAAEQEQAAGAEVTEADDVPEAGVPPGGPE